MTAVLDLLIAARRRGVGLRVDSDGTLRIRRPPDAVPLARQLLARKADVVPLVPLYNGITTAVNWQDRRHTAPADGPCVLCGKRTTLADPDGRLCHKTCFETAIRDTTTDQPGRIVATHTIEGQDR